MRALLLAGVAVGWMNTASATPITATYDFVDTFTSGPNAIISGSVTLTYDPTIVGSIQVSNFTSSVLAAYTPVVATHNAGRQTQLVFGNDCNSTTCTVANPKDFWNVFNIDAKGNVISNGNMLYSDTPNTFYVASSNVVTREAIATAVPEPASLALLGMGVAGLAALRRRRAA